MNEKQNVMIALGVAMGANCIPCFEHIYEKAKNLGVSDEEVNEISETADRVKNGASIFLKNVINEITGLPKVVEEPCCSENKTCSC